MLCVHVNFRTSRTCALQRYQVVSSACGLTKKRQEVSRRAEAIRMTVVPIRILIRTTVVPITPLIGTTVVLIRMRVFSKLNYALFSILMIKFCLKLCFIAVGSEHPCFNECIIRIKAFETKM